MWDAIHMAAWWAVLASGVAWLAWWWYRHMQE
jgi:hypothetical protein